MISEKFSKNKTQQEEEISEGFLWTYTERVLEKNCGKGITFSERERRKGELHLTDMKARS